MYFLNEFRFGHPVYMQFYIIIIMSPTYNMGRHIVFACDVRSHVCYHLKTSYGTLFITVIDMGETCLDDKNNHLDLCLLYHSDENKILQQCQSHQTQLFSSPEHTVLKVSYCNHQLSGNWCASVNIIFSVTSGSIGMKLHRKHPLNGHTRIS